MNDSSPSRIGTWLSFGSPAIAELAALAGFHWVLLDLEHGCATDAAIPDQLRAMRGTPTEAIVRVGAPHPDLIGRLLDWGAHGLMVPHVDTPEQAEAIVRATRYTPRGHRGVSRTVRSTGYGLRSAKMRAKRDTPSKVLDVRSRFERQRGWCFHRSNTEPGTSSRWPPYKS
jgi:2-dehydro-3-deoxyglucarate aldolase/4-hydroxy-2-oxoheptanedioate aldolase